MNISLDNLTKRQVTIAERLWRCQTEADVAKYISMLPSKEQAIAKALQIMMIQAAMEAELEDAKGIALAAIERAQR